VAAIAAECILPASVQRHRTERLTHRQPAFPELFFAGLVVGIQPCRLQGLMHFLARDLICHTPAASQSEQAQFALACFMRGPLAARVSQHGVDIDASIPLCFVHGRSFADACSDPRRVFAHLECLLWG
jgi:hypothetical protein